MVNSGLPWIDAAELEVGTNERNGGASKYFELWGVHKYCSQNTPWCSAFVSWVLHKSIGEKRKHLAAREWSTYGIDLHCRPIFGAIVIMKRPGAYAWNGHIGFSIDNRIDAHDVKILGGNQSDMVCTRLYERDLILKCVWPEGQGALLGER
jgi:uncharacterized protein (TIGR02594 family)